MSIRRYLSSKRLLAVVWVLLVVWAAGLAFGWTRLDRPAQPQIAQAQPTFIPTGTRPRPTANLVPGITPANIPRPTPVLRSVERIPGPLVWNGDFLALSRAFDEELAFEHILALADPQMAGRKPGHPANTAPDYVAQKFAEYGLQPAGEDGTYFQPFPVPYLDLVELPSLTIIGPEGQARDDYYHPRTDFNDRSRGYSGSGQAKGPVLWANYGAHSDYDEADAVGKIVLIRQGGTQEDIYRNAVEHGAAGMLIIAEDPNLLGMRFSYKAPWIPQTIPAFLISNAVAEDLLAGSGYTLADLSTVYDPILLPSQARMSIELSPEQEVMARNALGVLPGSDPTLREEIVVIGAHLDHMGADPCPREETVSMTASSDFCDVWVGANDDASGVAVLLEVARLWQEGGYTPQRSVLFAAWDAEEAGLLGSIYYVQHPSFPITRTVGMIQLDMVGAGPNLLVDGPGHLADQVVAIASQFGVTATQQAVGSSDHAPFIEAHVPAVMLIWSADSLVPTYHQLSDVPQNIEPDVLARTGMVANLSLLALSWDEPALHELVDTREGALRDGNRAAFLATSDPNDGHLRMTDEAWFDALRAAQPAELDLTMSSLLIAGDVATATIRLRLQATTETNPDSITYPARFVRRTGEWHYAGPAFQTLSTQHFTISYLPGQARDARDLAEGALDDSYQTIVALLGGEARSDNILQLYPSVKVMWGGLPPSLTASYDISSARAARVVPGAQLPVALFELALRQRDVLPLTAPWLAQGLASVWESEQGLTDAIRIQSSSWPLVRDALNNDDLAPAEGFPLLSGLEGNALFQRRAQAWAMAQYLVDIYDWTGMRRLVDALAAGQGLAEALQSIGTSPYSLDLAWRDHFQAGWLDTEVGIQKILTTRSRAIAEGDLDAFLTTEDPSDPTMIAAAHAWFADLSLHPLQTYNASAALLSRTAERAIARLTLTLQPADSSRANKVTYQAGFRHWNSDWYYAGPLSTETAGQQVILRAQLGRTPGEPSLEAAEFVATAEQVLAQVTSDLGLTTTLPVVVELYDDAALFRASVPTSLPDDAAGWTTPGSALRLLADRATPSLLAEQLTRRLLSQAGLANSQANTAWLIEGLVAFETQRIDPALFSSQATRHLKKLRYAAQSDKLARLGDLADPTSLSNSDADLAEAQAWGTVAYLADEYGLSALRSLMEALSGGESFDAALSQATGLEQAVLQEAWTDAARGQLVPEQLIKTAQTLDLERVQQNVAMLTANEFRGRPAGSAEADVIATFLANELAVLGLTPAGEDATFFQSIPLSVTILTDTPTLTILDQEGSVQERFIYQKDFVESVGGAAAGGVAEGPVVWVRDLELTGMRLVGKIVLVKTDSERVPELARRATESGATGLLAYTGIHAGLKQVPSLLGAAYTASTPEDIPTLPVAKLAQEPFEAILGAGGYTLATLSISPPALELGVQVRLEVPLTPTAPGAARNVIGRWPASASLGSEESPLVLAAGYDGPGDLPDGTVYQGANQAAGAATLLEIARTWRDHDFRPARPVLFVFSGAEFPDGVGLRAFLARPTTPLNDTVGILEVGGIGAGNGFYLAGEGERRRDAELVHQLTNSAAVLERRFNFEAASTATNAGLPRIQLYWDGSQTLVGYPRDNTTALDEAKLKSAAETISLAAMMLSRATAR